MNPLQLQGDSLDEAFREGDEEKLYNKLLKYISLVFYLRQGEHDEDFIAETANFIFMNRSRFRGDSRFSTWVLRVVANKHLNWLRDHKYERLSVPIEEIENLPVEHRPSALLSLKKHFKRLQKDEQEYLECFLSGMTQKEIAAKLGFSLRHAKSTYKNIVEKLRRYASEDKHEEEGEEYE